jgi:RNA recognition motif-containing protein
MAGRSIESEQRKLMAKLYVGNLAFSITEDSLLRLFTGKGYKVGSARIITDRETGRSRGFGFIELGPEDDAAKAIGEFNGLDIDGRILQVNEARPQEFRGGGDRSGGGRGYSGGRSGRGGGGRRSY